MWPLGMTKYHEIILNVKRKIDKEVIYEKWECLNIDRKKVIILIKLITEIRKRQMSYDS